MAWGDPYVPPGGGTATAAPPLTIGTQPGTGQDLWDQAGLIEAEERVRYQGGLQDLLLANRQSQDALSQGIDSDLLFSRASDAVGARGKSNLDALRRSLGGRGINPNSGAAGGLLSRLIMSQEGQLVGATRDIAIDDQRTRQVNAAQNFQNALNLANYRQSPVSGARYEASQNIFEGNLVREGIAAQAASARAASKDNLLGGIIGGVGGLLGGLL